MPNLNDSDVLSPEERESQQALVRIRPRLDAMAESLIDRRIALDASAAAVIALATVTKILPLRPELVARFGPEAGTLVDDVPLVALATRQADVELAAVAPAHDLSAQYEPLRLAHQLLITDADSLAYRGFIDPKRLDPARSVLGYQATIDSVELLVAVLREHWEKIDGHTPITAAQLDHAVALAKRLSKAVGARDNGVNRAPSIETRIRVISMLVHEYEELRRMMSYLRWHQDDVDAFAPSLWANRGRRARTQSGVDPSVDNPVIDADVPQSPAVPAPNNGGPPFMA